MALERIELVVLEYIQGGRPFYERVGFLPIGGRETMALSLDERGQVR